MRIRRIRAAVLLVGAAVLVVLPGYHWLAPSSSASSIAPLPTVSRPSMGHSSATATATGAVPRSEPRRLPGERGGGLGEADGAVPDGTTVFDDGIPGVANLDPAFLASLREAATDAAADGVIFLVDSGWRSAAYQGQLRQQAILKYGSEEEAARWVATPSTSAHVSGDAVDIGRADATQWLSRHGAAYDLCQTYANEPWHYELRPDAVAQGCPAMYADPTHDPRTRQ